MSNIIYIFNLDASLINLNFCDYVGLCSVYAVFVQFLCILVLLVLRLAIAMLN